MPQYSQNIVERFGAEKLPAGWPRRIFIASFLLFIIAVGVYVGLAVGYKPYLASRIDEREKEIAQLVQAVPEADQENFLKFYSQLANLKDLLNNHIFASQTFSVLEKNTNQKVYYKVADLKIPQRELVLEGIAQSYEVLAQQLEAFNQMPEIERYTIIESQFSEGQIRFRISLIFQPHIFKAQP